MDHGAHPHASGPSFGEEDTQRLRQGLDIMLTRLMAWEQETPGACSCDSVEIMSRAFAVTMIGAGARLTERQFQAATSHMLRATREFCRSLRKERQILGTIRGVLDDLDEGGEA